MTVRPDRTVSHGHAENGHHRFEDRHGGPNGARHHLEEERLERLVRAAQEVSDQPERGERDGRRDAGQDRQAAAGGADGRPAPRTASLADIERADDEGMPPVEEA
ncbi:MULTISPECIES: hypothetical protein [Sorangium]|uniref:Uncharacterized protein n=1 Tax=Sorangium cellulosum TaxID=56 RepID=A0A4P2QFD9_SORCE|nr:MULTISPECIES: hypothetical protein [Sorangium]AUX28545.1 uncharacterized protein SOCE836_006180 [Sorangium cellulosum]WCQ87939.1 hypothetical protein NQZ70_00605 [Sorangium sp. Soce836]